MAEEAPTRNTTRTPIRISTRSSGGTSRNPSQTQHASSSEKPTNFIFKTPATIPNPEDAMRKWVKKYQSIDRGFVVTMKENYVAGDCRLCVPYEHANKYLKDLKDKTVSLFAGDREWKVTVRFSREEYRFGKGWRDFVKDNKIEVNDMSVFKKCKRHPYYRVLTFSPV